MTRPATCSCGQLAVTCEGDPVRISLCHCLECQRRTGSVFGVQARWPRDRIAFEGTASHYVPTGDAGGVITFAFCPRCGTTITWAIDSQPDLVAVAVGAFADPGFPRPTVSVYEARRHPWVVMPDDIDHYD